MSTAPPLLGETVALEPLRPEDSPLLFAWINERELVIQSAPFEPVPRAQHDTWFDAVRMRSDGRIFGIRLRETDRLVGSCQLHSIHRVHGSAELQIRIGAPDARRRGVGTEATRLLLQYAFEELELHRVCLHVFEKNGAARGLYERVGFRTEGVMRDAARIEGEWVDVLLMAVLRSEYTAR